MAGARSQEVCIVSAAGEDRHSHKHDERRRSIWRVPTERSGGVLAKPPLRTTGFDASIRYCANSDAAGESGPVLMIRSSAPSRSSSPLSDPAGSSLAHEYQREASTVLRAVSAAGAYAIAE